MTRTYAMFSMVLLAAALVTAACSQEELDTADDYVAVVSLRDDAASPTPPTTYYLAAEDFDVVVADAAMQLSHPVDAFVREEVTAVLQDKGLEAVDDPADADVLIAVGQVAVAQFDYDDTYRFAPSADQDPAWTPPAVTFPDHPDDMLYATDGMLVCFFTAADAFSDAAVPAWTIGMHMNYQNLLPDVVTGAVDDAFAADAPSWLGGAR